MGRLDPGTASFTVPSQLHTVSFAWSPPPPLPSPELSPDEEQATSVATVTSASGSSRTLAESLIAPIPPDQNLRNSCETHESVSDCRCVVTLTSTVREKGCTHYLVERRSRAVTRR
jgi:hypothetical protein